MSRTGSEYIASLKDERRVMVDGKFVSDVTADPAFAGAVSSIAGLYDLAVDPQHREAMTFTSPTTGKPVNKTL